MSRTVPWERRGEVPLRHPITTVVELDDGARIGWSNAANPDGWTAPRGIVVANVSSACGGLLRGRAWQVESEGCALARLAVDLDGAAEHTGHQIVDDVESQPASALPQPGGEEGLEDTGLYGLRNAASIIPVAERNASPAPPTAR